MAEVANRHLPRVAFSGAKFSGKDTYAAELCSSYRFYPFSFSDQLKKIAATLFSFMKLDYPSEEKESTVVFTNPETGVEYTPRKVWEAFDVLPQISPNIFVDMLDQEIVYFLRTLEQHGGIENVRLCIPDVRRPAELTYIQEHGFLLVYIKSNDPRSDTSHVSESFQALLEESADVVLFNDKEDQDWQNRIKQQVKEEVVKKGRSEC